MLTAPPVVLLLGGSSPASRTALLDQGCLLVDARRADPAFALIERGEVDVVLAEGASTEVSQLLAHLADDPSRFVPVLVACTTDDVDARLIALESGVHDVLPSTHDPRELCARVMRAAAVRRRLETTKAHASALRQVVDDRTSELQERERRLRDLFESVGLVAVTLDREGLVTFCNDHLAGLLERTREEVEGRSWFGLAIPAEIRDRVFDVFQRAMAGEPAVRFYENDIVTSGGVRRRVEWNNTVLRDRGGRIEGVASIGRDVTAERRSARQTHLANVAIDGAVIGIAFADLAGRVTRVNEAFLRLWGLASADEAVGHPVLEFWEHPDKAQQILGTILTDGQAEGELVALTRDGPRTFRLRASRIGVPDGPTALMATFSDVTEQRRAESRLLAAQRIARLGNWEWNQAEDTLWWSDELYRIFGLDRASFALSLDAFIERVVEEDRQKVRDAIQQALASDERYSVDHRILRPDGSVRWVQEHAELWRDARGNVIGMIGTAQDVTEQRAVEEELRRTSHLLETVVANAPIVIYAMDEQSTFTLSEGKTLARIGLQPGQVVGLRALELFRDVEGFPDAFRRAMLGHTTPLSSRVGEVEFEAIYAPLLSADGEVEGVIGIALDVTEQKRLEAHLAQSQKMEAVGMLAGGIAHDFNNLLAVIVSASHLIDASGSLGAQEMDDLQQIIEAAQRAAGLTQQLLAFGRQQTLEPAVLEVSDVVRSMKKMLRRLIGEDIELRIRLEEDLPRVLADRTQLDQVLLNLAINARDAMPRGGTLSISTGVRTVAEGTHATLTEGKYVCLCVEDTGTGMTPEVVERVFEPFYTTKEKGRGTGLGLATCHGIARQSGGDIEVRSRPGEGTTFSLLLPATDAAPRETTEPHRSPAFDPRGATILLVEDEPQLRYVTTRALESAGLRVISAVDGTDGLDRLRQLGWTVDLVLTDVVMPRLGGVELARQVRDEMGMDLPFLFMSGYTDGTTQRYGIDKTLGAVIQKPFTPQSLLAEVRDALRSRE